MPVITTTTTNQCPCCCPKVCYTLWQSKYTCVDGTFSDPTVVELQCLPPGSAYDWTQTSSDSSTCTYQKLVATGTCCTSVGECSASAAPAPPTDHSDCTCCPCNDDSLGLCDGCISGTQPSSILVTFSGGTCRDTCEDCGDGTSQKVVGGIAGASFTLTRLGQPCTYLWSGTGTLEVDRWVFNSTCSGAPTTRSVDIVVQLGQGHGRSLSVFVDGYQFFAAAITTGGDLYDCCQTSTLTDSNTLGDCYTGPVCVGATATITPCPMMGMHFAQPKVAITAPVPCVPCQRKKK